MLLQGAWKVGGRRRTWGRTRRGQHHGRNSRLVVGHGCLGHKPGWWQWCRRWRERWYKDRRGLLLLLQGCRGQLQGAGQVGGRRRTRRGQHDSHNRCKCGKRHDRDCCSGWLMVWHGCRSHKQGGQVLELVRQWHGWRVYEARPLTQAALPPLLPGLGASPHMESLGGLAEDAGCGQGAPHQPGREWLHSLLATQPHTAQVSGGCRGCLGAWIHPHAQLACQTGWRALVALLPRLPALRC